jgi:hypothetical protein
MQSVEELLEAVVFFLRQLLCARFHPVVTVTVVHSGWKSQHMNEFRRSISTSLSLQEVSLWLLSKKAAAEKKSRDPS